MDCRMPAFLAGLALAVPLVQAGHHDGNEKVQPCLAHACEAIEACRSAGRPLDGPAHRDPRVRVDADGRVQVYVCVEEANEAMLASLKALGLQIEVVNEECCIIQGWLPAQRVAAVADLAGVERVRTPVYGRCRTGSVNSEGDAILKASNVRALGFTGSGIKVGVISDGVGGLQSAKDSGDLPSTVEIGNAGFGSEGVAMLEIVHDLASGAALAFSSGNTSLEFIASITILRNLGCRVIVDDLGFSEEPYFEDGAVAQAAQTAVNAGVFFCSAAGNEANDHYEADFAGLGPRTVAGQVLNDVHNFGGGDFRCRVLVPAGRQITVHFQWNNAFGSASDNYDVFLFSQDGGQLLASSTAVQDGNDDPQETLVFGPPVSNTLADLVISRTSGSSTRRLEFFEENATLLEFQVAAGSVVGHPAATGVFSLGAIDAADPGNDELEVFSSQGPSFLFFPAQATRNKPEACGIDNVSVTGSGGFGSPFIGTSAAAPHIAAIAALLLSARSTLTPAEITSVLQNNAVDLGVTGYDFLFGSGRVNAETSLAAAQSLPAAESTSGSGGGGGGGGGGGCFIATAAYGSSAAAEVEALRQWRDNFLMDDPVGQALVRTYYAHSPVLARSIAGKKSLCGIVRRLMRNGVPHGEARTEVSRRNPAGMRKRARLPVPCPCLRRGRDRQAARQTGGITSTGSPTSTESKKP